MLSWQDIYQFITENQCNEYPLWVALSGGVDSVCLLHLAHQLQQHTEFKFKAIHVNHDLS